MTIRDELKPIYEIAECLERRADLLKAFPDLCKAQFSEEGLRALAGSMREIGEIAERRERTMEWCVKFLDEIEKLTFWQAIRFVIHYRWERARK